MRAWTFQRAADEGTSTHRVGWYDPEGKRREKKFKTRKAADSYLRKIEGEIAAGVYQNASSKTWADFRQEFERRIAAGKPFGTQDCIATAFKNFERITKPGKVQAIKTATIDEFIAKRRKEPGLREGETVAAATINKDLRHLKAALRIASEWGYLPTVPKFRMVSEPKKLNRYVSPDHFTLLYQNCQAAKYPKGYPFTPEEFWKGLLVFIYMTGWRISEPLLLRRVDVDHEQGTAVTRHRDNKGKRDDRTPLHPLVLDHLRPLKNFTEYVFPWPHNRRMLYKDFERIQKAAGVHLDCAENHVHTESCHFYGFHDFRRAFATMNAETLSAGALQSLMRHSSYTTTQGYINYAQHVKRSVADIHVPDVLRVVDAS